MAVCLAPITTSSRWKFVNQKWVRDRNKPCGKTAKGTLQDGTPACGVHLNAEKVRMRNAALKAVESSRLDEMAGEVGRSLRLSIHPLRFNPLDPNNVVVPLTDLGRVADDFNTLLDALWQCYVHSGADTDGDEGPGALIAGMGIEGYAKVVVREVKDLKDDYDEACEDG